MADQIQKIKDEERKELEVKEAKEKEAAEKGYWWENPADGSFWWTGKEPPGPENPHPDDLEPEPDFYQMEGEPVMTDKEWDELQLKWYEQTMEEHRREDREERNRVAREKYQQRKAELAKPIEMPEIEMSEYDMMRQIIKERDNLLGKFIRMTPILFKFLTSGKWEDQV